MTKSKNGDETPAKLYKYGLADRVDTLAGGKIRFTQPQYLNDPSDVQPEVEQMNSDSDIEKRLSLYKSGKKIDELADKFAQDAFNERVNTLTRQGQRLVRAEKRELYRAIRKAIMKSPEFHQARFKAAALLPEHIKAYERKHAKSFPKNLNNKVGILSLAESANSVLMWAHYAGEHAGLVIEFDGHSKLFESQNQYAISKLTKVTYEEYTPFPYLMDGEVISEDTLRRLFYVKGTDWSYEKEWRMVASIEHADDVVVLPNSTKIYLYRFAPTAITGVIFGFRMSSENKAKVLEILSEDRYKHVIPYQALFEKGKVKVEPYMG